MITIPVTAKIYVLHLVQKHAVPYVQSISLRYVWNIAVHYVPRDAPQIILQAVDLDVQLLVMVHVTAVVQVLLQQIAVVICLLLLRKNILS